MVSAIAKHDSEIAKIPARTVKAVVNIDNGDASVIHDRHNNILTLALYNNKLDIPLATFEGELRLTGGGSSISLSRKTINDPINLEVDYYWCGGSRDGKIYQEHEFKGNEWKLLKEKDRT